MALLYAFTPIHLQESKIGWCGKYLSALPWLSVGAAPSAGRAGYRIVPGPLGFVAAGFWLLEEWENMRLNFKPINDSRISKYTRKAQRAIRTIGVVLMRGIIQV
jgi:hypothetical protein